MFKPIPIINLIILSLALSASAEEDFNISKVGYTLRSTAAYDLKIRDDYAYCADIFGLAV